MMKVKVTRHFIMTTEHDIPDGLSTTKLDVRLSLAAEENCHLGVTALRGLAASTDAYCFDDPEFALVYRPKERAKAPQRRAPRKARAEK
jgi:hypothetical protein